MLMTHQVGKEIGSVVGETEDSYVNSSVTTIKCLVIYVLNKKKSLH